MEARSQPPQEGPAEMFEIADEDEAADAANLTVWLAVGLIVGGTLGFIAGVAATNLLWVLA